jgi:pyruvate dehydrogenase E1 component alpha subunit
MAEKVSKEKLLSLYETMLRAREFEDKIYYMFLEGLIPGTIHLYQGEEAVAAGVCCNLRKDDIITSTHRPHGHAVAKGVNPGSLMAEIFGRSTGCCKGKGGSMHVGDPDVGMPPAIAIVAGGIPLAAGSALAFKFQKKDNVAVSFFGDGATNEGVFHETLNMASLWSLPVIFVCENNQYAASTALDKAFKMKQIYKRADAYGMPGVVVDGNDVVAVYTVVNEAVARARSGRGPTLVECITYRHGGHSRGDACNYRPKGEKEAWLEKDPIKRMEEYLIKEKVLSDQEIQSIREKVVKEMESAAEYAKNSPFPKPEDTTTDVWA